MRDNDGQTGVDTTRHPEDCECNRCKGYRAYLATLIRLGESLLEETNGALSDVHEEEKTT